MFKKNHTKNLIFLFLISTLLFICLPSQTMAYLLPGAYVEKVNITEANNGVIKGDFLMHNNEKYYIADLNYVVRLLNKSSNANWDPITIDEYIQTEKFTLAPNEELNKSFSYEYPKNIYSGDYILRIQIISRSGEELGWRDQNVSITGIGKFLDISNQTSMVSVKNQKAFYFEGINANPEDEVSVLFDVKNIGDEITATPNIKIYKQQINMTVVREYQDKPIFFSKNNTQSVNLTMPKITDPGSYLAEISFLNNGEKVSGIQSFRWVIRGENAKIVNVQINKDYYKAGESVDFIIDTIGPTDFSDSGIGNIQITLFDKDKNIVGEISKEVLINSSVSSSNISIPIKNDLVSPTFDVKLEKNGKIFDETNIKIPLTTGEAKELNKKIENEKIKFQESLKFYALILVITIILLLSLVGAFISYKKLKQK